MRIYAKGTLTVASNNSAQAISGISFAISTQGKRRLTEITPSTGAIVAQGVTPLCWIGNGTVTFTVGDKAIYGTDGESKAGQFDFDSITIYTNGDKPEAEDPTHGVYAKATAMAAGSYVIYAEENIATPLGETQNYGYIQVAEAKPANDEIKALKANAFEFVAVDGGYNIKDSFGRYVYQTGTYNTFNVSADLNPEVDAACYVWAVEVVDGAFVIKNTSVEKTIQYDTQYGSFGSYPDERGVYPVLYKFVKDADNGDVPEVVYTSVTSMAQLLTVANKEKVSIDVDLTVMYANGSYVYAYDGNSYGLIYKSGLGLEAGQVIAKGWKGAVSIYNNLIEIVPDDATLATSGTANIPMPTEIEADDVESALVSTNQNAYVKLLDVTFAEATPAADAASDARTYTGKMGEFDVTFYQRFGLESVEAGTYNVIGFISVYKEAVQIYPVAFAPNSGIASAAVDGGAAVYYNMQGVRVDNPRAGQLYIRLQDGQATKVVK